MGGHHRITILVGEFGSGKTEIAVNYALQLKTAGLDTAIVDIDLVKPCFRTRENRNMLEQQGITVIAPDTRLANADLPILPHNLIEVFSQPDLQVVMDVGGGAASIVLGQLKRYLDQCSYQALLVINTKRPFTRNTAGILDTLQQIEHASRLKISGLVSNTNLGTETTINHVLEGLAIVEQTAERLNMPVKWVVVPEHLARDEKIQCPVFILKPYTRYPWME